jgi:hypothetical protein
MAKTIKVAKKQVKQRGGAIKYRTKKLPGGKYIHVAITRKKGPRGGKTVSGPVRKKKKK